jgi:N-acetyl-alpha-D-muramate 1-phosphate uridylyltransferase
LFRRIRPPLKMSRSELPSIAILAGGLATRLEPVTQKIPKALIDVAGRPFLDHQLRMLKDSGIRDVVLCVGHLGEMIQQQFGDGSRLGVGLRYSFDGERLLGTAGALRRALPLLGDEFFVLYGDSYLTCDYAAVVSAFRRSGKRGLMTVFRNDGKYDASNVEYVSGGIVNYSKENRTPEMRHIDYGLGVFQRQAFAEMPEGEKRDLSSVYQSLLAAGELAAFEAQERFYEIGSFEGLRDTIAFLSGSQAAGRAETNCLWRIE